MSSIVQQQQRQQLPHPLVVASAASSDTSTTSSCHPAATATVANAVLEQLQAGAFRSLIQHLQLHSHEISNMELMTISGFCRNCLAKWMVLEARLIVDTTSGSGTIHDAVNQSHKSDNKRNNCDDDTTTTIQRRNLCNTFGYDEAAQCVYGMEYNNWKSLHMKPATTHQLEQYQSSQSLHAVHDMVLLEKRAAISNLELTNTGINTSITTSTLASAEHQQQVLLPTLPKQPFPAIIANMDDRKPTNTTTIDVPAAIPTATQSATTANADADVVVKVETGSTIATDTVVDTGGSSNNVNTTPTTIPTSSTTIPNNNNSKNNNNNSATDHRVTPIFHSNVCCVDIDDDDDDDIQQQQHGIMTMDPYQTTNAPNIVTTTTETTTNNRINHTNTTRNQIIPPVPDMKLYRNEQFPVIAIVTISDRAYAGIYSDMSGPMIADTIRSIPGIPSDIQFIQNIVVPDDMAAIQAKIQTICDNGMNIAVDCIITTGGTGFGIRDVTPEATREMISYELINVISHIIGCGSSTATNATADKTGSDKNNNNNNHHHHHLRTTTLLSRGVVGVISSNSSSSSTTTMEMMEHHHHQSHQTLIVNLPGSPVAIQEMLPLLLPYLLQIVIELQHTTPDILHIG